MGATRRAWTLRDGLCLKSLRKSSPRWYDELIEECTFVFHWFSGTSCHGFFLFQYAKTTPNGLTMHELWKFTQGTRNIMDPVGWTAMKLEWFTLYLLCADGTTHTLSKEAMRAQYNGVLRVKPLNCLPCYNDRVFVLRHCCRARKDAGAASQGRLVAVVGWCVAPGRQGTVVYSLVWKDVGIVDAHCSSVPNTIA